MRSMSYLFLRARFLPRPSVEANCAQDISTYFNKYFGIYIFKVDQNNIYIKSSQIVNFLC